jgi:hypothetical protein
MVTFACAPRPRGLGILVGFALLWLLPALFPGTSLGATRIEVSLDRNPIPINESFTLIFSAKDSPDGDPDFEPLNEDFEILGRSQSNQFSFDNGRGSRSVEWRLTVLGRREGTLPIPPIAFGSDRSEPFSVTVLPAASGRRESAGAEIFLEVEAEPKNPYVQAQVVYTLRVLSRIAFAGDLGKPEPDDAPTEKLDGDRSYTTTRNGVQYKVDERRYAIFPQKSGPFRIPPVRLEAQVPIGGRSLFGQFFNRSARTERLQSEALELNVRPIPPAFQGRHWLPAAALELEDAFDRKPPEMAVGEPLTRTLTVQAEGATLGVLPELDRVAGPVPSDLKHYPDQPVMREQRGQDGVTSLRQEKAALIAAAPGTYRLPAVEIPWWNTRADRLEMARLPERILTVTPAAGRAGPEAAEPEADATAPAPAGPQQADAQTAPSPAVPGFWPWLALFLGLGWLATALAWWRGGRGRRSVPVPAPAELPERQPERELAAALERACRTNDASAARKALAAWGGRRWPGATVAELARRCGGDLGREIGALDRALYAPGGSGWQGGELWRSFKAYADSAPSADSSAAEPELEPLYKL